MQVTSSAASSGALLTENEPRSSHISVLVRSNPKYFVEFWFPQFQKYVDLLEQIQGRAIILIKGQNTLPYEKQLNELALFSPRREDLGGPPHSI